MYKYRSMSDLYEENKEVTSKYVHNIKRFIQIVLGMQLTEHD